jgi:hypothetical protein
MKLCFVVTLIPIALQDIDDPSIVQIKLEPSVEEMSGDCSVVRTFMRF